MTLPFNVDGKNLYKYCKDNKYSYNRIRERMTEKGMSAEEALKEYLTLKYDNNLKCKYSFNGIPLTKWCKIHNISYTAIIRRMNYFKIPVDKAIVMEYEYCNKQHLSL